MNFASCIRLCKLRLHLNFQLHTRYSKVRNPENISFYAFMMRAIDMKFKISSFSKFRYRK